MMTNYHKYNSLLLWVLLFLGPLTSHAETDCLAVTQISQVECESLLQLYNSTDGANWTNNEGWNTTNTPCRWYGITCENNGVVKINMLGKYDFDSEDYLGNNLVGTIPNFSGLPNLQVLYLSKNQMTGEIPNFRDFPNLQKYVGNSIVLIPVYEISTY